MNEREALLRAVCDNPDDDTPRLVFADWLQENGNESDCARAEFIRAQIEQTRHTRYTIPWFKCDKRIRKLLAEHEKHWHEDVPNNEAWSYRRDFPRGFLEHLLVSDFKVFRHHADAIFTASPIKRVDFRGELKLAVLGRVPRLDGVSEIWGRALNCTPEEVRQFINDFKSTRLTRFALSDAVLNDEAYRMLREHFGKVFSLIIT